MRTIQVKVSKLSGMAARYNPRQISDHDLEALIDWPYKLVVADGDAATLYRVDGALERPVRATDTSFTERMVADLAAHRERVGEAQSVGRAELDAEVLESLRALGYLD